MDSVLGILEFTFGLRIFPTREPNATEKFL